MFGGWLMEADYKITYVGYIETDEEKLEVNAAGFVDVLITLTTQVIWQI
jgi:hypothetical protein